MGMKSHCWVGQKHREEQSIVWPCFLPHRPQKWTWLSSSSPVPVIVKRLGVYVGFCLNTVDLNSALYQFIFVNGAHSAVSWNSALRARVCCPWSTCCGRSEFPSPRKWESVSSAFNESRCYDFAWSMFPSLPSSYSLPSSWFPYILDFSPWRSMTCAWLSWVQRWPTSGCQTYKSWSSIWWTRWVMHASSWVEQASLSR